jgi:hypothetical protein
MRKIWISLTWTSADDSDFSSTSQGGAEVVGLVVVHISRFGSEFGKSPAWISAELQRNAAFPQWKHAHASLDFSELQL